MREFVPETESNGAPSPAHFAVALAGALHRAGAPAHRLELAMNGFASVWGLPVKIFALPSAVLASVGDERLTMQIATPGEPDLARLADLHELAGRVTAEKLDPPTAMAELNRIERSEAPYRPAAVVGAFTLCAASAAPVFGGGLYELVAASLTGLVVGLAAVFLSGPLLTTLAAVGVGATAGAVGQLVPLDQTIPVIAGLLVFLPGFSLTIGMAEMSTGHRITGSSRVLGAGLALLQLGFGVALGKALVLGAGSGLAPLHVALPTGTAIWSLASVALSFTVLLRAPPSALPLIAMTVFLATRASAAGAELLGPSLGPALAALIVTTWSNGIARATRRPTALTQVPGILLLVPGSMGFRAVDALMQGNSAAGVEVAFQTALSATALVGGLLLGHAILPTQRDAGV